MKDKLDLLGRILIAGVFVFEGIDSLLYFNQTKAQMTEYNILWQQDILLGGAIFLLILGSIMLLIGYRTGLATLFLAMYWIPITFILFSFWDDPQEMVRLNKVSFVKNMAILGGLLLVYVNGSKKLSVKRLFQSARLPKWRERKDRL